LNTTHRFAPTQEAASPLVPIVLMFAALVR